MFICMLAKCFLFWFLFLFCAKMNERRWWRSFSLFYRSNIFHIALLVLLYSIENHFLFYFLSALLVGSSISIIKQMLNSHKCLKPAYQIRTTVQSLTNDCRHFRDVLNGNSSNRAKVNWSKLNLFKVYSLHSSLAQAWRISNWNNPLSHKLYAVGME